MDKVIKVIMIENIYKSFKKLGIEGTLDVIESISHAILRLQLRQAYYKLLKRRLK